jgi:hypothetical protein
MIRRRMILQQIHEMDVLPTSSFDLPRAVDMPHIGVQQNLEEDSRWILDSPYTGVGTQDAAYINPFHDCVQ